MLIPLSLSFVLQIGAFCCPHDLLACWTIVKGQTAQPLKLAERERGIELYKQGKAAEAVQALKKVVKDNAEDYAAWYFLGLALIQKKELKDATKSFETALKLQPGFAAGHTGLSYALLLRNKSSDAVREAQAALSLNPGISEAHYVIGVVRLRASAQEDALQQAEIAIKLSPQSAPAYLLKSQALVSFVNDALLLKQKESPDNRQARCREAADSLEKYLQLSPNTEERETWTHQLESLRFYGASHRPAEIFSSMEVTTKARVLSKPEPAYTDSARSNQIRGTVILRVIFASDGTVKHFLVVTGLPYGLTEAAIKAARRIKFVPGMIDSRPVSIFIQLEYNFNLY